MDAHFDRIERDHTVLKWMLAANLTLTIVLFCKVFFFV
jgi:hypothetical protein